VFQCKALSCRRWKSSFFTSTHERVNACNTDPKLTHILLAGFRSYFATTTPPPPACEFLDYPNIYRKLVKSETAIGWGHLLRDRIVVSWALIQQEYMHKSFPDIKFDPGSWHKKILHPLFIECHTLWTLRNGEHHGTDQQTQRMKRMEQLERDLTAIFK
jgi:hypothetical protein